MLQVKCHRIVPSLSQRKKTPPVNLLPRGSLLVLLATRLVKAFDSGRNVSDILKVTEVTSEVKSQARYQNRLNAKQHTVSEFNFFNRHVRSTTSFVVFHTADWHAPSRPFWKYARSAAGPFSRFPPSTLPFNLILTQQ